MKLIEAMKKIKDLQRKAEDLRTKVGVHCADVTVETPLYTDQRKQVSEWLQAHSDILKEILGLREAIQRTNLETRVTITLGDHAVTKSIAAWIHRRRDLATLELEAWKKLTDRGLKEGILETSQGQRTEVKIRRYYDAKERDTKIELYRSEPHVIDATLEVTNAVTDLIEA
jgi:hypothetical protein